MSAIFKVSDAARERDMVILRKPKKAMIRAMCEVTIIGKRSCQELMAVLCLQDTSNGSARVNGVVQYGHVLRGMVMMR